MVDERDVRVNDEYLLLGTVGPEPFIEVLDRLEHEDYYPGYFLKRFPIDQ
jgi:hypothetical protein